MVQIGAPTIQQEDDALVVSAEVAVRWPDAEVRDRLWFRLPRHSAVTIEAAADACFSLGLLLAMASRNELRMEAPVSPRLLAHSVELQDVLLCWYPKKLARAALAVPSRSSAPPPPDEGTISFFTGGVDSFFTAATPPDRVTALAYVHGFDIPLEDTAFFARTLSHLQDAASGLGKPLVHLATNLKRFTSDRIYWGYLAHGAALAAAGTLLHSYGSTLLVPSSRTYADLSPWGTHALTDRLHSTEYLSFVHDGAAVTRVEKTVGLAGSPAAQRNLRVCWQKTGAYNCGLCEKCLRTMTTLKLAGALDAFEVFPATFSIDRIRDQVLDRDRFAKQNYQFAQQVGDVEVAAALREAITRFRGRKPATAAKQTAARGPAAARLLPKPVRIALGRLRRQLAR